MENNHKQPYKVTPSIIIGNRIKYLNPKTYRIQNP